MEYINEWDKPVKFIFGVIKCCLVMGEVLQLIKDILKGEIKFSENISGIAKVFLTVIVSHHIYVLYHGAYVLVELNSQTIWNYIVEGSVLKVVVLFLSVYFFFYGFIYSLLRFLLRKKIHDWLTSLFVLIEKQGNYKIFSTTLYSTLRRIMRVLMDLKIITDKNIHKLPVRNINQIDIEEIERDFYGFGVLIIHLFVVFSILIHEVNTLTIVSFLVCFFFITIISIIPPTISILKFIIVYALRDEYKYSKQLAGKKNRRTY